MSQEDWVVSQWEWVVRRVEWVVRQGYWVTGISIVGFELEHSGLQGTYGD